MNHQSQTVAKGANKDEVSAKDQAAQSSNKQSESKQVDVLVIGGGPAALGLLVNAAKTNRLNELLQGDGIAIIEAGMSFGGGLLGRYGINSNTSGGGFLKCSYKKIKKGAKEKYQINFDDLKGGKKNADKKKQVAKDKQKQGNETANLNPYAQSLLQNAGAIVLQEKKNEPEILSCYKDLYNSNIAQCLQEFGKNTAPLPMIGHFLNYAGNHLLSYIHSTTKKKIFYPLHRAISVQLMTNGEILTKVKKQNYELVANENGGYEIQVQDQEQIVLFRSKVLVVANGGVQGLHPELFNWFPSLDPEKVIASDDFLKSQGYLKSMRMINEKKMKKIVIIGGSHSGFSCAWMLLNGPAAYYSNNAGISIDKTPYALRKQARNCVDCCKCGIQLQNLKRAKQLKEALKGENSGANSSTSPVGKVSSNAISTAQQQQQTSLKCNCVCICFGLFEYDDWQFDYSTIPQWEEASIEILYRDHIRVFYNKVSDAEFDGYTEFEAEKFSKKDGYLYSFTGLRGDAKELYLRVTKGQETRVKLIQARDANEQRDYVDKADIVIWACGYQTKAIPFKDTDRKRMELSQVVQNTQYDVDSRCRIMLADGYALGKCFACGIGYPVRTKDGMIATSPNVNNARADSFSLYMNFIGDNLLKSILPKQKNQKNTVHKVVSKLISTNNQKGGAYQMTVKQRIQQYKSKNQQEVATLDEKGQLVIAQQQQDQHKQVLRHKSLNVRNDEIRNTLGKKQQTHLIASEGDGEINAENVQKDENVLLASSNPNENTGDRHNAQILANVKQQHAVAKSVDRAKNGMQNKLTQMARSPQLLQKKQQVIKMKTSGANNYNNNAAMLYNIYTENIHLNQDLVVLLQGNDDHHQQKTKKKVKNSMAGTVTGNESMKATKSPYNMNGKMAHQQDLKASSQAQSRQGREIIRSSQAGRKLDQIQSNDPPFKMSRSSQIGVNGGANKQQRMNRGSMHGGNNFQYNNQLYNSMGTNSDLIDQFKREHNSQRSANAKHHNVHAEKKLELPPIVQPINQQNVHYQEKEPDHNILTDGDYYGADEGSHHNGQQYQNQKYIENEEYSQRFQYAQIDDNQKCVTELNEAQVKQEINDHDYQYEDDKFENEEDDPFKEDVSSEGSCSIRKSKDNLHVHEVEGAIPGEEESKNEANLASNKLQKVDAKKKSREQLDSQSQFSLYRELNQRSKEKPKLKNLPGVGGVDLKNLAKAQLSPILQDRNSSKNISINLQSQQNQKTKEAVELTTNASSAKVNDKALQNSNRKKRYLNQGEPLAATELGNEDKNMHQQHQQQVQQRQSKSTKQTSTGNNSTQDSQLHHQQPANKFANVRKGFQSSAGQNKSANALGGTLKQEKIRKAEDEIPVGQKTPQGNRKIKDNKLEFNE